MSKIKKNDKQKIKNLEDAIERRLAKDGYSLNKIYILDDENAIVITGKHSRFNNMIHYKMIYGGLYEVAKYSDICIHGKTLKKHKVFMLLHQHYYSSSNICYDNVCTTIYDYENCRFIATKGMFDNIGYDASMSVVDQYTPSDDYLEKYNCFLGYFTLSSKTERGIEEQVSYKSLINGQSYWYSFEPPKETYYALINKDGSIRGNRLFRGENLTKIEDVIDLRKYSSLEEFKKQRIEELTQIKNKNKQAYYERLKRINNLTNSPYLDEEVVKVLSLESINAKL